MTISDLKHMVNIRDLADRLSGNSSARKFCPKCQPGGGKSPDLEIYPNSFYCFKCQVGGDIFGLVQLYCDCDFKTALDYINQQYNNSNPLNTRKKRRILPHKQQTPSNQYKDTTQALKPVKRQNTALKGQVLKSFLNQCETLTETNISWFREKCNHITLDILTNLQIRICRHAKYTKIMDDMRIKYTNEQLEEAGLIRRNKQSTGYYDGFRYYASRGIDIIVIPYISKETIIALKTRPLLTAERVKRDNIIRFMNTSGSFNTLYNENTLRAKDIDKLMVCEGETDVWSALSAGYSAVGVPGAGTIKTEWTKALAGCSRGGTGIFVAFDSDAAGQKGAQKLIAGILAAKGVSPHVITLPENVDLTEYLNS